MYGSLHKLEQVLVHDVLVDYSRLCFLYGIPRMPIGKKLKPLV